MSLVATAFVLFTLSVTVTKEKSCIFADVFKAFSPWLINSIFSGSLVGHGIAVSKVRRREVGSCYGDQEAERHKG